MAMTSRLLKDVLPEVLGGIIIGYLEAKCGGEACTAMVVQEKFCTDCKKCSRCINEKLDGRRFCQDCLDYIASRCKSCEKKKVDGYMFCDYHICRNGTCPRPSTRNSNFCGSCKCHVGECSTQAEENGEYCEEHSCSECYLQRCPNNEHCSLHMVRTRCRMTGCRRKLGKWRRTGFCDFCQNRE